MSPAKYRAMVATLLSVFHLTLPEIARLTDRQIADLYFHPRDEHGQIEEQTHQDQPQPGTLEHEITQARIVAKKLGMDADEAEREARAEWNSKSKSEKLT